MRWSSAGHLPPLLRLPGGGVRVLSLDSDPMLGISPDLDRVERVPRSPRQHPAACTDGLVERRDESIADGLQRLATALRDHGHLEARAALPSAVLSDVLPDAPDDDTALLVLRPLDVLSSTT